MATKKQPKPKMPELTTRYIFVKTTSKDGASTIGQFLVHDDAAFLKARDVEARRAGGRVEIATEAEYRSARK